MELHKRPGCHLLDPHTKGSQTRARRSATLVALCLALAACGTPSAPDYGGRWKPVNRFSAHATSIPITPDYVYFVSPLDATLTRLLTRWASDSGRRLDYGLPDDFTLHLPASAIRTNNLEAAAEALNRLYSAQGVFVDIQAERIHVHAAPPSSHSQTKSP